MRPNVWLVVVSVGVIAHHLSVALVAGAPPETASVSEAVREDAVVIEVPANAPAPRPPVKVRLYSSSDITSDALRAALNVAEATFAAASVNVVWKVCGPGECKCRPLLRSVWSAWCAHRRVEATTPDASAMP